MSLFYEQWTDVPADAWRWPHFTPREMACRRSGSLLMASEFMDALEALRVAVNRPLPVTSGYRDPEHNALVSTTGKTGPHTTGLAADIAISGEDAFILLSAAVRAGTFTGIGLNQRGPYPGRFIHLDTLRPATAPRPRVWTYS